MRKITADYLYAVVKPPVKDAVLVIDDVGKILEIGKRSDYDQAEIEQVEGILCPGFINTHCHLELSHLKGKIPANQGMIPFLLSIVQERKESNENILDAMEAAEAEMIKNGIVAIGDISNTNLSIKQKLKSNLYYHTFIEVFSSEPDRANEVFSNGMSLLTEFFEHNKLQSSIVPHALYSVSDALLKKLISHNEANDDPWAIHNQESIDENQWLTKGEGKFKDFFKEMGIKGSYRKSIEPLEYILSMTKNPQKVLLVHNTYTKSEDLLSVFEKQNQPYWCFCPASNLYITGELPSIMSWVDHDAKITLGTDSLASNTHLSIIEEMKIINEHFQEMPLETLIKWATINGAKFLGLEAQLGSIEVGKQPGINLISKVDYEKGILTEMSNIKKLA